MNARQKFGALIVKSLRFLSYFVESLTKSSVNDTSSSAVNPSEMIRVTDGKGREYLCPIGKLKDANFVKEREKPYCLDYEHIAQHDALNPA